MVIRMVSSFNDILKYLPPRLTDKIKLAITDTGQTFFDYRDGGDFITSFVSGVEEKPHSLSAAAETFRLMFIVSPGKFLAL